VSAPDKNEARELGGGAGFQESTEMNGFDSASGTADGKRLATLRAKLALIGAHVVTATPGGGFLVAKAGWSRECADLDALEAFSARIGVCR
jgi:hypothetical protein